MKLYIMIFSTIFLTVVTLGIVAPNNFKIERAILIQKPSDQVFSHLKFLKNHDQWSAWAKKDPQIKKGTKILFRGGFCDRLCDRRLCRFSTSRTDRFLSPSTLILC